MNVYDDMYYNNIFIKPGRKLCCEGTLPVDWEHHGSRFC